MAKAAEKIIFPPGRKSNTPAWKDAFWELNKKTLMRADRKATGRKDEAETKEAFFINVEQNRKGNETWNIKKSTFNQAINKTLHQTAWGGQERYRGERWKNRIKYFGEDYEDGDNNQTNLKFKQLNMKARDKKGHFTKLDWGASISLEKNVLAVPMGDGRFMIITRTTSPEDFFYDIVDELPEMKSWHRYISNTYHVNVNNR